MILCPFIAADLGKLPTYLQCEITLSCFPKVAGVIEFIPLGPLPIPEEPAVRDRSYNFSYFLIGLFLSSIIVTSVGTFLISHQILSITRDNTPVTSLPRYSKIRRIVVESGVIYSTCMLVTGIAIAVLYSVETIMDLPTEHYIKILNNTCIVLTYSQALATPLAVNLILSICDHF